MNRLIIKNLSNTPETVDSNLIQKVYELALEIGLYQDRTVELEGNLLALHAKLSAYEYLTGPTTGTKRFPNLSINVTDGLYVSFEDPLVELIILNLWGNGASGMTASQLGQIGTFSSSIFGNSNITTFNEFQYFNASVINLASLFARCGNLLEISLPAGTTQIKLDMFLQCTNLTTIRNTEAVTSISGLNSCSSLASINTPALTTVGNYAIAGCTALTTIDLSHCTEIGRNAFENCTSLITIDLSSMANLNTLSINVFKGCTHLLSATLNSAITTIPELYFYGCSSLSSIDLSNVNNVKEGAFLGCSSLTMANTHLDFSNFTYFGSRAFADCTGLTGEVTITITLNDLYGGTFANTGFSKVKIVSSTITHLGYSPGNIQYNYAFQSMPNVTIIDATECSALTIIGNIKDNPNLEWMLWPVSATTLDIYITCGALNIVIPTTNVSSIISGSKSWDEFYWGVNRDTIVYVPDSVLSQYTSSARFSDWSSHFKGMSELPSNIKTIYNMS